MPLAVHPASTTRQQPPSAARAAVGVLDEVIRPSIGIEDADDPIAALDRALVTAAGTMPADEGIVVDVLGEPRVKPAK